MEGGKTEIKSIYLFKLKLPFHVNHYKNETRIPKQKLNQQQSFCRQPTHSRHRAITLLCASRHAYTEAQMARHTGKREMEGGEDLYCVRQWGREGPLSKHPSTWHALGERNNNKIK